MKGSLPNFYEVIIFFKSDNITTKVKKKNYRPSPLINIDARAHPDDDPIPNGQL